MTSDSIEKNVLVAPLNWGLGHATRCIPIIKGLEETGYTPILASDGQALALLKKEFQIIGSVHNQREYFRKLKQNCYTIVLSPLFYTEKYSNNQILNILKFNQISREWKVNLCALGGINFRNIKKTRMIKIKSLAFRKLINEKTCLQFNVGRFKSYLLII